MFPLLLDQLPLISSQWEDMSHLTGTAHFFSMETHKIRALYESLLNLHSVAQQAVPHFPAILDSASLLPLKEAALVYDQASLLHFKPYYYVPLHDSANVVANEMLRAALHLQDTVTLYSGE